MIVPRAGYDCEVRPVRIHETGGTWAVSLDTEFGAFDMDLMIEDKEGKVAASTGSPDMGGGMADVTDITRSGESLVLEYEIDAQVRCFLCP